MSITAGQVDWDGIKRRIADAHAVIHHGVPLSDEERKHILKDRAHKLSRKPQEPPVAGEFLDVLEFELAGEHFGFELTDVSSVCLLKELIPVPCTPSFVLGIINLRGEILTVIDLKAFFDLPPGGITELNKIIILQGEDMELGILADGILGVRTVTLAELQPSLPTLTGIRADYLRGVTHDRLVVLDAAKILLNPRILVDDRTQN